VQNSLCVQVLRCPILAALLHGTRAVANYGTFAARHFQQRAPAIFRGLPSHWAHILISFWFSAVDLASSQLLGACKYIVGLAERLVGQAGFNSWLDNLRHDH